MEQSGVYRLLSELNKIKWRVAVKGLIGGLIAGLLVALYRLGIEFGTETAIRCYTFLRSHPVYILLWLAGALLVGYVAYRLMKWEPYAQGSGIPQVEGIVLYGMKIKWYSVLIVRFVAGILTSFFGISLGREGPSIQIGAAGSQAFAKAGGHKNKIEENYLITAGASAGLAAAFNAPLSGIIFALEEVHRTFSPNILIAATTAALTADVVSTYFFGLQPVLNYVDIPQLPIRHYVWLILLGVCAGLIGSAVNKCLLAAGTLYKKLPPPLRPVLALLLALPCGLLLPEVLGGGQNLVSLSEQARAGVLTMAVYLTVKLLFTCTSFGSGLPGGIFMPILSIGALTGGMFGQLLGGFGVSAEYIPAFCVCAMAGVMSSSVKAPITSILLMAEMSGTLVHLMPVAAVAFVSLLTSDLLRVSPIYEILLERLIRGQPKKSNQRKARTLVEIPIEIGSKASGKAVRELSWPEGSLIVALRRGAREFVPNGDTVMLPGDYLVVLSTDQKYNEVHQRLTMLCYTE